MRNNILIFRCVFIGIAMIISVILFVSTSQALPTVVYATGSSCIYSEHHGGQIMDSVNLGEKLTVEGEEKGSYLVITQNGKKGWLATSYASLNDPKSYFILTTGTRTLKGYLRSTNGSWQKGFEMNLYTDDLGEMTISFKNILSMNINWPTVRVTLKGGQEFSGKIKRSLLFYFGDPAQVEAGKGTILDLSTVKKEIGLKAIDHLLGDQNGKP